MRHKLYGKRTYIVYINNWIVVHQLICRYDFHNLRDCQNYHVFATISVKKNTQNKKFIWEISVFKANNNIILEIKIV